MTRRVSLSLPDDAAAYLEQHAGRNISAFVTRLLREDAITRSAASHAQWYAQHPSFAQDAADERAEAARSEL